MPSDARYLPVVRGAVGNLAAAVGWEEAECLAITLAVDEALANVIRPCISSRADGLIELECRESGDGLEFVLLDHGDARIYQKYAQEKLALRSAGRTGDAHHPERDGSCILQRIAARGTALWQQELEEEDPVKISIREVGDAKVVEVDGDVDLGTSPLLRRTLFDNLPARPGWRST